MHLLARAFINGLGWKLGVELGRYVTKRLGLNESKDKKDADKDEDEKESAKGEEDQRDPRPNDSQARAPWTVPLS